MDPALLTAVAHQQAGRLAEAQAHYRALLARDPNHAEATHLLGILLARSGQTDEASSLIRRAMTLNPAEPRYPNNLAVLLAAAGRQAEAAEAAARAVALRADYADAWNTLGNALNACGRSTEAVDAFGHLLALAPNVPQAHNNLANALAKSGRSGEAIAGYQRATSLQADYFEAWANLGITLSCAGRYADAIAPLRRASALRPDHPDVLNALGYALYKSCDPDAAIDALSRAIALRPNLAEAWNTLGCALKDAGHLDESVAAFRRASDLDPNYAQATSNLAYTVHFHPDYDPAAILREQRAWDARHGQPLKPHILRHANDRSPQRRLRIGYVSPDFRSHSVGRFMLPMFQHHDHAAFEICCYSDADPPDAMTAVLRATADLWCDTARLTDEQLANLVREDRVDILVDLTMHMAANRLRAFARKPAPVQVSYVAYPSTTGVEAIDYRITDPWLDPPGANDEYYVERSVRLPHIWCCYQPGAVVGSAVDVGPLPALSAGHVTFGCLNAFCKAGDAVLATWGRIMRSVPGSRLLMHAHEGAHRRLALERLQREGIAPDRVRFAGYMPGADYLRLYQSIDIALDTFPYNGGTTTCDALWLGVPVVTLAGRLAAGRQGLTLLSNVGLPQLVSQTPEDYLRIAVDLARDLRRLADLRAGLRQRMLSSPLMDAPALARNMEAAYRQMWIAWCTSAEDTKPDRGRQ
jgi:predicted O-linked N-acetylglucosamine transferase (SPINDLY family)